MTAPSTQEKAFALIFALVASAWLLEAGLRLFGPEVHAFNNMLSEYDSNPRGYFDELRWDGDTPVYGIRQRTGVGIGGRAPDGDAPASIPVRILGMGDSQAQGQGVRAGDTFYAQLGDALSAGVRNVAVDGYDLDEVIARYAYETSGGARYPIVIYALVLDDFGLDRDRIEGLDFIQFQPGHSFDPWRQRSAIWNLIAHTREQATLSQQTTQAYLDAYTGAGFAAHVEKLARLDAQVRRDGSRLVVAVLPLLYDFDNYPFHPIHDRLGSLGESHGISVVDLLTPLSAQSADDLWVHPTDHHPNEHAHRTVAATLDRDLRAMGAATNGR
jgi:hypothetical protein